MCNHGGKRLPEGRVRLDGMVLCPSGARGRSFDLGGRSHETVGTLAEPGTGKMSAGAFGYL